MVLDLTEDDKALLADPSAADELDVVYGQLDRGAKTGLARVVDFRNVQEDDVHDAAVKAAGQWLAKPAHERTPGMAYRIAHGRGFDLGRHIVRRRPQVGRRSPIEPPDVEDPELGPLEVALEQEVLQEALSCLESLTPKQRECIEDVIMGEQSESEWAEQRHITQQAANKLKNNGIRALRGCMHARRAGTHGEQN
jgi:DNA-directed RNA polymerase specialized sigma24 family protein